MDASDVHVVPKYVEPKRSLRGKVVVSGSQQCACAACEELFSGSTSFGVHRVTGGDSRRCLTRIEMWGRGWAQQANGAWSLPAPAGGFAALRATQPTR